MCSKVLPLLEAYYLLLRRQLAVNMSSSDKSHEEYSQKCGCSSHGAGLCHAWRKLVTGQT